MKLHPLLFHVIVPHREPDGSRRDVTGDEQDQWLAGGQPVLAEEEPNEHRERVTRGDGKDFPFPLDSGFINLRGPIDFDGFPELRQIILDSPAKQKLIDAQNDMLDKQAKEHAAKDAKIAELERVLGERYLCPTDRVTFGTHDAGLVERMRLRHDGSVTYTEKVRAEARNAALEEAALEVQKAWDQAFAAPGVPLPLRNLEDRIRGLKK